MHSFEKLELPQSFWLAHIEPFFFFLIFGGQKKKKKKGAKMQ